MKELTVSATLILIFLATCVQADVILRIGKNTTIAFATVDEGREILTTRDDFVRRMSPFDRASRMKTGKDVSEEEYLEFVGRNVMAWDHAEKQTITSAIENIQNELKALSLPFPKEVFIVKTTGREEGGAAYTRGEAIVLPKAQLQAPMQTIQRTISHELFHIMSRTNPDLAERLYAAIGFVRCGEVAFPMELASRKITNPDAPRNDHCIRLRFGGEEVWAIPILFSSDEKYDMERGGEFFDYLQFRFLLVEREAESSTVKPIYAGQTPMLVGIEQISGFFEQVGMNTEYIIHPEEILADNFALLVLRERNLPSPEIIASIERLLNEARIAEPSDAPNDGSATSVENANTFEKGHHR